MDDPAEKPHRHHNLDWLRVLIILNLIPFHAAWLVAFVKGFSHVPQDAFVYPSLIIIFISSVNGIWRCCFSLQEPRPVWRSVSAHRVNMCKKG